MSEGSRNMKEEKKNGRGSEKRERLKKVKESDGKRRGKGEKENQKEKGE